VGPRDLRRAVQDDIQEVLGDPAARGDRLAESIAALGARHSLEAFRAVLSVSADIDCAEPQAREIVLAIDGRRRLLADLLGRDPGFAVASCDLLHEAGGRLREPVFRQEGSVPPEPEGPGDGVAAPTLQEAQRLETRRAERSGRPLAVVVLSTDLPGGLSTETLGPALAALRAGTRDVDYVAGAPPADLIVLLPCTGGREGLRAAERFRATLVKATGCGWRAGVAVGQGSGANARLLEDSARRSVEEARRSGTGAALHRPERRRHPRSPVGPAIAAGLRRDGVESETVVEDMSLGGALLSLKERLDPGAEIVLALRPPVARPAVLIIPARVYRVSDGPVPGAAPWKAAVVFEPEVRLRVAGLLAGLIAPRGGNQTA